MDKSLPELIDECGVRFRSLVRESSTWGSATTIKWSASGSYSGTIAGFGIVAYGQTSKEAVQNLLEILEKNKDKHDAGPCYRCNEWPCNCPEGPLMEKPIK